MSGPDLQVREWVHISLSFRWHHFQRVHRVTLDL